MDLPFFRKEKQPNTQNTKPPNTRNPPTHSPPHNHNRKLDHPLIRESFDNFGSERETEQRKTRAPRSNRTLEN